MLWLGFMRRKKNKYMYQHNEKYVVAAAANVKRDVKSQFDKLNK